MALSQQLLPLPFDAPLRISPTDVSQFVRLGQCQRFLRLRLAERFHGADFIYEYGVSPQEPPPLMMQGGLDFETQVYQEIARNRPSRDLRDQRPRPKDDSAGVIAALDALGPGDEIILMQPRLVATLGRWRLTGEVDLLRLRREGEGHVSALIVDVKSSALSKVEHRLQIAMYAKLLAAIAATSHPALDIALGVLYRGEEAAAEVVNTELYRAAALAELGAESGYLEIVEEVEPYLSAVDDLVTGPSSAAERIAGAEFENVGFHLTYRCDWCRYNPFCMKWAAERDDLSLIPYLTENDKLAIQRAGVETVQELSTLKQGTSDGALVTNPEQAELAAKLSVTWPVGARLDELVLRARRYRSWKGDAVEASNYLPNRGYGSLPYCDASHNPNLVRIYIDAQHDGQTGHVYLLGALVSAAENGVVQSTRRKSIVQLAEHPPFALEDERELLLGWIDRVLRAIVDLAAPDQNGDRSAPIHLIFFNRFDQELFLEALSRHAATILSATPLYDFVTQLAAFDSPIATFLVDDIRELRNYPMLSQSLQSVARYLKFDWNSPLPFSKLFRERTFDYVGKFDEGDPTAPGGSPWYTSRSRFDSQIPVEFAYAAWDALPEAVPGKQDDLEPYRQVGRDELIAFQTRRMEALEHIAGDFRGNRDTTKSAFSLPDLSTFEDKGSTLAQALAEFVVIERLVELSAWKNARLAPPERRMLSGISLVVRYEEEEQELGIAQHMRECLRQLTLRHQIEAELRALNPDEPKPKLSKEQREATKWSINGAEVRLRIEVDGIDCDLQEALDLSTLRENASVIVTPRWTVDSRLPVAEQRQLQPTPKQMLYGLRGDLKRIEVERDGAGRAQRAHAVVRISHGFPPTIKGGFVFGCFGSIERPLEAGLAYVLDGDINDWTGHYSKKVADSLVAGRPNALYERLAARNSPEMSWPDVAAAAQRRFLAGFEELARTGDSVEFEPSKQEYIAQHGATPILLVQGPPGTGKSFTTAYALFARLQGAMAADVDFRIVVSCHTHKAIDVVIDNLIEMRDRLAFIQTRNPDLFDRFFDARLLEVPIFRARPNGTVRTGVVELKRKSEDGAAGGLAIDRYMAHRWAAVGATPNAVHGMLTEKWKDDPFGRDLADCLVLDEASQLGLPVATVAALPLKPDGRVIVVGDHRQMPPIVKHDWSAERRRTFQEFRAFDSLFLTLLSWQPRPPLIQFSQSFRLHREMADFLRREIYRHDGIDFRSARNWQLRDLPHDDSFLAAVLSAEHALTVVLHNERASQLGNAFERQLALEIAEILYDERIYGTGDEEEHDGFGIVVPHRLQRANIMSSLLGKPGKVGRKSVIADTVERFQGDEREVIIFTATESDPAYLLAASGFLLEPRRLTVALSRAKRKLILLASRSIFELFSPDEETFANAQLWKDLLRETCTVSLWSGERHGHNVEVWGNRSDDQ